jgi:hypothetical protein
MNESTLQKLPVLFIAATHRPDEVTMQYPAPYRYRPARHAVLAALLFALWAWAAPAPAQEPPVLESELPCALTWDAAPEAELPHLARYVVRVDGAWTAAVGKGKRAIACEPGESDSSLGITGPGDYEVCIFARAIAPGERANSPETCVILRILEPAPENPPLTSPQQIRLILADMLKTLEEVADRLNQLVAAE